MNIREALRNKKRSLHETKHKINSWQVYGESTVVLFYENWTCSSGNLHKLIDYLAMVDRLIIALPAGTSEDIVFQVANLQVVDGVLLCEDAIGTAEELTMAQIAFEGFETLKLSEEAQLRLLLL